MSQIKSAVSVLIAQIIGLLIFLVLLGIANTLTYYIPNETFHQVVSFLNSSLWLIVTFTLILLIGEIFNVLIFPLNIPAPLFNAVGGILVAKFIFNIIQFIIKLEGIYIAIPFDLVYIVVAFIVFIAVIVVGYIRIFSEALRPMHKKKKFNIKEKD